MVAEIGLVVYDNAYTIGCGIDIKNEDGLGCAGKQKGEPRPCSDWFPRSNSVCTLPERSGTCKPPPSETPRSGESTRTSRPQVQGGKGEWVDQRWHGPICATAKDGGLGGCPAGRALTTVRVSKNNRRDEVIQYATVRQVSDLWAAHQGWSKWPKERRYDAIVIQQQVRKFPAPLEFWQVLIAQAPLGAQFVYFTKSAPGSGVGRLYGQWLEARREWEKPALDNGEPRPLRDLLMALDFGNEVKGAPSKG